MTQNIDAHPGEPVTLSKLRAGTLVGGYRLLRRLGAGGMGVVWEATDEGGRHVAMKILHPQIAADPMARRRLDREANVLARVKDSRVARILDIETGDGADGSGVTFVITELIDGPTLQYEVDHEGAYDLTTDARDLADLAHGLVDSLTSVHAAGVIHRDLKPSNVMLSAQGPVLIDFGIAQVADDVRLTQTGQVTGTPGFIPPEMLDGGEPNADVDWYACAGVLLFAVTGLSPFGSGPWQAVFRRVYAGTPELGDLEEVRPALARAFTAALAPGGPGGGKRKVSARLVIGDPQDAQEMAGWRAAVDSLHAQGGLALAQICDSHDMAALDDTAWDMRVDALIRALPDADTWEIGNEIGGDWLGEGAVAKAQRAAKAVRERTSATTVLTLYYQLGQADPAFSLFSYVTKEVTQSIRDLVDVVGLSVYPQLHPLGTAADRVLTTLDAAFPASRIAVTELGYGGQDLNSGPWWFGSASDPVVARTAVAEHVTGAALGRADAWGAPFWWYYLEDQVGTPGGQVAPALAAASNGF